MALVANNFLVGKLPEPPKAQDIPEGMPTINAKSFVVVNKPIQVVPVVPDVAPVIPVKPKPQPRKSAYHNDMTIVHKL